MRKVFCITAAAAALAFGAATASAQTVLFEENFDDVADIDALLDKPGWLSSAAPVEISTEQARSGNQSLKHTAATTGNVIADLGGGYVPQDEFVGDGPLLASIWQYIVDPSVNIDSSLVLAAWEDNTWGGGALENFLVIGMYSFSPSAGAQEYVSRVVFGGQAQGAPDQGWVLWEDAPRIGEEWVHLAIWANETVVYFYVNGEMIGMDTHNNNPDAPTDDAAYCSIRIGAAAGAPMVSDVYYDDLQVVLGASAPEPVAVPEWHLY